jgi:signal transduction histidine kinase
MDNLQKFVSQVRGRLYFILIINNVLLFTDWWIVERVLGAGTPMLLISLAVVTITSLVVLPLICAGIIARPTKLLWQAILHIAPDAANVPAPDLQKPTIGHELVANLVSHVYQLASVVDTVEKTAANPKTNLKTDFVANALPLPLIILDKEQTVLFANQAMLSYVNRGPAETIGQSVYSVLDMSFGNENTLDKWLEQAKANTPVDSKTWERVRLAPTDDQPVRQFDLAAYYNRSNPEGFETILVFFDHTESYSKDDQALSFVALAVHELRTPITLLRGYLEALEEDMQGNLTPETADFIHKMKVSAQSLTAFINNMLNVARIENNQLVLQLHEDTWEGIVNTALNDLMLRAKVQGVEISTNIAAGLPSVGVDRVSIYEVLVNLVDNAIKYSAKANTKKVLISSCLNNEGLVETIVQDQGVGIPGAIMQNLFEKFYRSHRSKGQVGGTGLGLYLSKAIVEAHGGHIWVRSKEGLGSTFGFTIVPYAKLADEKKNGNNNDINRGVHGWIKNHSLYSR